MSVTAKTLDAAAVWKFQVDRPTSTGRSFIDLPAGAELLSIGMQGNTMVVWALVSDEPADTECHRLIVANTGRAIPGFPDGARFLGSVTHEGIVWHVWDGGGA